MRAVIIENGIVINAAETDADFAAEQGWIMSDTAHIGDLWDGNTFTLPPMPTPDIDEQWAIVRTDRNQRLTDTDWWVISAVESGSPQNFERAAYRQALRDITTQADPFAIVWPESPSS